MRNYGLFITNDDRTAALPAKINWFIYINLLLLGVVIGYHTTCFLWRLLLFFRKFPRFSTYEIKASLFDFTYLRSCVRLGLYPIYNRQTQ
ncbi:hypothetical protein BD408DRAFT_240286 [Parasitella parasitica]|nr:hypothetical protein BD408DRAFT_240286 [Parasitella parasitica]